MANLASMLPLRPKTAGRLSEVFLSAYRAILGESTSLGLPNTSSYVVILVDGLGVSNIKGASAYARNINQKLSQSSTIFSGFPTTTASSLASFATGKNNGEHGFLGYRVFDRAENRTLNLLNDLRDVDARKYQDLTTVSELASETGITTHFIGPGEYQKSGFTMATMPLAIYHPAKTIEDRFRVAETLLRESKSLSYLYIPELDQLAHRFGTDSSQWLQKLEELDAELYKFLSKKSKNSCVILTADHGVLNVPKSEHLYLDELPVFDDLIMLGGDPRVGFLYFEDGVEIEEKRKVIISQLGHYSLVASIEELVESGWIDSLGQASRKLAPDLVLLPKGKKVIYHRKFAKAKSLEMIGQHGGMSQEEWEVPLLIY